MYELHANEQYFFDAPTLDHLARFIAAYAKPCCVCAPLLAKTLVERGHRVRALDIDERFSSLPGFQRYNLYHPEWLDEKFDLIICDPPFYKVSLSQLFHAIRTLAHYDFTQPLLITYLRRRSANILGTFSRFHIVPTGYLPGYQTVQTGERNAIELFGNLGDEQHQALCSLA